MFGTGLASPVHKQTYEQGKQSLWKNANREAFNSPCLHFGVGSNFHPFRVDHVVVLDVDDSSDRMKFSPKKIENSPDQAGNERQGKCSPNRHDDGLDEPSEENIEDVHVDFRSQKA